MPMRPAFNLKYVNLTLIVDFAQIHIETFFFNLRKVQTYTFVYKHAHLLMLVHSRARYLYKNSGRYQHFRVFCSIFGDKNFTHIFILKLYMF